MNFNLLHRVSAFIVFAISSVVYLLTVAPTLSFWDCGEFITAAVTMGIPHPPGAPTFQLIGNVLSHLPIGDVGFRVNLASAFSSSLTVLFVYLVSIRLLRLWNGEPKSNAAGIMMILAAATGALIFSFSDTFWFNASEAEVYGIGMFFISITVWISLEWYAHAGVFDSERSLLLIAYMMGLSIGAHLLAVLSLFFVFIIIYFRDRDAERVTLITVLLGVLLSLVAFYLVYPGVVKLLPNLLSGTIGLYFVILLVVALIAIVASKNLNPHFRMGILGLLLVALGYSTYSLVLIRSNQSPALNENAPTDLDKFYSYLNREQYGDYPLLRGHNYDNAVGNIDTRAKKYFPRRWNPDENIMRNYAKYSSDTHYFLKYQLWEMYLRYFGWNFVGRAGDVQGAPVDVAGVEGDWSESSGYPNRYYGIPLLLGLLGMFYHFRKDMRTFIAMTALFLIMGVGLVIYFNMADSQPRERDYFFVGSFYVFAIWTGLGVYGLWEMLKDRFALKETIGFGLAGLIMIAAPGNMLRQNYQTHNRHFNYVAWDYAYNLLQSCDQDAILFTGGDNDTFPVWYLQYVGGVRRDIRVVNLSLVNTNWYMKQLKNERPYGAKTVKINYTDGELDRLMAEAWETQTLNIPIDRNSYDASWMSGVAALRGQQVPEAFAWEVPATRKDRYGTSMLIGQEIMIREIVKNHINDRPIYFALSTAPSDRLGLDGYLVVEGLAGRVTPFRLQMQNYRYYPPINTAATERHLMKTRSVPDSNRAFGFMFRELNNPSINLDEASTRMIYSFRLLYMELAKAMYQDLGDSKRGSEVMEEMDKIIPEAYHEWSNEMQMQRALSYFVIQDNEKAREHTASVERLLKPDVDRFFRGESQDQNPFSILYNLYYQTGQYERGIELLQAYQKAKPGDPSLDAEISSWRARAAAAAAKDS